MVEKRIIDKEEDGSICHAPDFKRPKLLPTQLSLSETDQRILETFLRKLVREEVERKFVFYNRKIHRLPARQIEAYERNFHLHFKEKLSLPIFTGSRIKTESGKTIQIAILDSSGAVITSGPLSSLKIEILILRGDFACDGQEDWTEEEFTTCIVREREGKRPLLIGDTIISLKDGIASVGELSITDNSCWMPSRKFRLSARVLPGCRVEERIKEAKTEAFPVKDHRGESYKKHYPPTVNDEVWRLENIMKGGIFHQRLAGKGINTVQEFLRHFVVHPEVLRNVLGMSNKQWESTILHAKTCSVSNDISLSIAVGPDQQVVLLFNSIYEVMGVIFDGQIRSIQDLDTSLKMAVDNLTKEAYRNWRTITEPQKLPMLEGVSCTNESSQGLQNQNVHMELIVPHQGQFDQVPGIIQMGNASDNAKASATRSIYDSLQQYVFPAEKRSYEGHPDEDDKLDVLGAHSCMPFHVLDPRGLRACSSIHIAGPC